VTTMSGITKRFLTWNWLKEGCSLPNAPDWGSRHLPSGHILGRHCPGAVHRPAGFPCKLVLIWVWCNKMKRLKINSLISSHWEHVACTIKDHWRLGWARRTNSTQKSKFVWLMWRNQTTLKKTSYMYSHKLIPAVKPVGPTVVYGATLKTQAQDYSKYSPTRL